jgi:plastocyanin
MRRIAILAVALASIALSVSVAPVPGSAQTQTAVSIDNYAFSPAEITVSAGTTVTWMQNHAVDVHTVTSLDGVWDSNILNTGATFSFQFTTPGDFAYDCSVHPALMQGVVHVR